MAAAHTAGDGRAGRPSCGLNVIARLWTIFNCSDVFARRSLEFDPIEPDPIVRASDTLVRDVVKKARSSHSAPQFTRSKQHERPACPSTARAPFCLRAGCPDTRRIDQMASAYVRPVSKYNHLLLHFGLTARECSSNRKAT